ncbi:MAG: tyrosine-type recombinase/integrase [Candidatus Bathyarchaeia archaeon]
MRGLTEGIQKSQAYDTFSDKANVDSGKSEPAITATVTRLTCPQCKSEKLWRDGLRHSALGDEIQRWLCRDCGLRFSDPEDVQKAWSTIERVERVESELLKGGGDIDVNCQICVSETKNLAAEQREPGVLRGNSVGDLKGKIIEFAWWMQKEGYAEATMQGRVKLLEVLVRRGADLYDPDTVKATIAKQQWSEGRKANAVHAYSAFLRMIGGRWETPRYKGVSRLPFIPKEAEIDQLISACRSRMATFLQLLKETGMRSGEAWQLRWCDVDLESCTVRVTPEKGSNPRIIHFSKKLAGMLEALPRIYGDRVFSLPSQPLDHFRDNFRKQRWRIARRLQNLRLNRISFHTFRHWKGTMEYHRTKDILHVMRLLGHKNIKNTLVYVQLAEELFKDEPEYVSRVAKNEAEACSLVEAGFEYVCEFNGHKIFRKKKY